MNTELARKVVVHALAYPEQHNQMKWVDDGEDGQRFMEGTTGDVCPSSACLAGWTIYLDGGIEALREHLVKSSLLFTSASYDMAWCETAAKCLDIDTMHLAPSGLGVRSYGYRKLRSVFLDTDNGQAIEDFAKFFEINMEECILDAKKLQAGETT